MRRRYACRELLARRKEADREAEAVLTFPGICVCVVDKGDRDTVCVSIYKVTVYVPRGARRRL
jgi:hypothetical protein